MKFYRNHTKKDEKLKRYFFEKRTILMNIVNSDKNINLSIYVSIYLSI